MDELQEAIGFDGAHPVDLKRLYLTPENRLHVHYVASSSDEEQLTLTLVPTSTKILRTEQASINSEAMLLQWLGSGGHVCPLAKERQRNPEALEKAPKGSDAEAKLSKHTCRFKKTLPRVVKHGRVKCPNDVEFLLTTRTGGAILSSAINTLSKPQQRRIDFQIGQLIRELSTCQSPNGHFGVASAVLKAAGIHHTMFILSPVPTKQVTNDAIYARWSDAFLSLLESVLRDAEDVALSLDYDRLRFHAGRFRKILDEVTVPCLVILDAGEYANTHIITSSDCTTRDLEVSMQRHGNTSFGTEKPQTVAAPLFEANRSARNAQRGNEHGPVPVPVPVPITTRQSPDTPRVIGIQDWHNSVFGDPLFTSVLTRHKNTDMLDGLMDQTGHVESKAIRQAIHLAKDFQHVDVRRLLYDCYHSVTTIVTEYYRMTVDGDDRELPARRRLVQAIVRLDDLDDHGRKLHPHPCPAHPIAKRKKSG
ncbi:hypothetical protein H634G_00519 [Metarhizium anisopliae BRIP 53293]|uniref:Aminoglycoside phosphotransferase domain-containing protein n=1 Tax=Metarhizium anisopliae BRIP 53293 TaxID=1291518 RepID=A0A0D9PDL9_METAN|nr:hypothetical protein H634G_00519 [Metarhizium anisopliae BRIP 53293]KJK86313.1 hypothetical protein H633G_09840 [Metarhizium anisopliae BRIP 53284]